MIKQVRVLRATDGNKDFIVSNVPAQTINSAVEAGILSQRIRQRLNADGRNKLIVTMVGEPDAEPVLYGPTEEKSIVETMLMRGVGFLWIPLSLDSPI
jgi:hypothetical protein